MLWTAPALRELRAETNAEHWLPRSDRSSDESFLARQPRGIAMLMNAHRPAHDDEQPDRIEQRQRVARMERRAHEHVPAIPCPIADDPGPIERIVFEGMDVHRDERRTAQVEMRARESG